MGDAVLPPDQEIDAQDEQEETQSISIWRAWLVCCGCAKMRRREVVLCRFILGMASMAVLGVFIAVVYELAKHHAERHIVAWAVGGFCVLLTLPLSSYDIAMHALHYANPPAQMLMIRCLWMVPIYSVESWLSLRFKSSAIYLETARECYEAYVLFSFHQLMVVLLVQYFATNGPGGSKSESLLDSEVKEVQDVEEDKSPLSGGRSPLVMLRHAGSQLPTDEEAVRVIRAIGQSKGQASVKHIAPFCCVPRWRFGSQFFHWTRWGVFQYVVIRVLCSIIACVMQALGYYGEGDFTPEAAYPWLSLIINFSQIWAMYCLILFYKELRNNFPPSSALVYKLGLVKAVVFVSWWQGIIVSGLSYWGFIQKTIDYSKEDIVRGLEDLLICIEMLLAAIAHHYVFSYHDIVHDVYEYDATAHERRPPGGASAIVDMLPVDVVAHAGRYLGPNRSASSHFENSSARESSTQSIDEPKI